MASVSNSQKAKDVSVWYQGRLRNTFLTSLLPISIIVILLTGGLTYYRARTVIQKQINTQLSSNLDSFASNLERWVAQKNIRLDLAIRRPAFHESMDELLAQSSTNEMSSVDSHEKVLSQLEGIQRGGEELLFSNYFIVLSNGLIVASTNRDWETKNISDTEFYQSMAELPNTRLVYAPQPFELTDLVALTSVPYFDSQENFQATIFGISGSLSMIGFLEEATSFNPDAKGYFITDDNHFIWIDPYQLILTENDPSTEQINLLLPFKDRYRYKETDPSVQIVSLESFDNTPSISDFTWLPALNCGLVVELPQNVAFGELNLLGPFTIAVASILGVLVAIVIVSVTQRLVSPLLQLTEITQQFSQGNWDERAPESRKDEIGLLSHTFNKMAEDLSNLYRNLENQVLDRTESLEQRSQLLEASAEVSQRTATVLEPDILIKEVVNFIQEQFNLYYVGLFLVDENEEWVILRSGTGQAGRAMMLDEHKMKIGEGMIGWCILNSQARIALDVGEDAVRFDNPYLPETRSEGAIPLRSRGRVIGALSIQSKDPETFNEDTIRVFQTMADQVASAIDNSQLFARTQNALEAERRAFQRLSQDSWNQTLKNRTDLGVLASSAQDITLLTGDWPTDLVEVRQKGEIIKIDKYTMAVPIVLRDQVLGVVRLRKKYEDGEWTEQELTLMDSMVDQFENALESARLFSETQERAAREKIVSDITSKIRSSTDPNKMLQTALSELRHVIDSKGGQSTESKKQE